MKSLFQFVITADAYFVSLLISNLSLIHYDIAFLIYCDINNIFAILEIYVALRLKCNFEVYRT